MFLVQKHEKMAHNYRHCCEYTMHTGYHYSHLPNGNLKQTVKAKMCHNSHAFPLKIHRLFDLHGEGRIATKYCKLFLLLHSTAGPCAGVTAHARRPDTVCEMDKPRIFCFCPPETWKRRKHLGPF